MAKTEPTAQTIIDHFSSGGAGHGQFVLVSGLGHENADDRLLRLSVALGALQAGRSGRDGW